MAKKQELYVSFERDEYKKGKSDILECQVDLLRVMRYIERLKQLKIQKNQLKRKLYELFSDARNMIDNFETELPKPMLPKSIKQKQKDTEENFEIGEEHSERYKEIDAELKEIQEKLRELNS